MNLTETNTMDIMVFGLFRIDIPNYIKVKAILAKEFHLSPLDVDKFPAWEYEMFMRELNQLVKEENDRNKKEMDAAGLKDAKKMSDPKYMERMQHANTPKMPEMPKMPTTINVGGFG